MADVLDERGGISARGIPTRLGTALTLRIRAAGEPLLFGVRLWALAKASDRPHRLEAAGVNGIPSLRPENRRAGLHCLGAAGKARG